ncbi:hypothetical protein [Sphingobium fluviale]|uniref:Uncharacterized protein n=1 Tax=Sphingobium fluviale TaxID=2506423 RepID=A0A4Q1KJ81_9SPHN|nr:hypothetical protein [Sphingobium fluviale]RXR28644.1 hypothetical protein EQG66_09770 [Sphingobium fluviale]
MDDDSGSGLTPDGQHGWLDERDKAPVFRGDGGGIITTSWWCAGLSVFCLIAAMMISTQDYMGNVDQSNIQSRFFISLLGGFFAWCWSILFGVGHIVRAIYFLPGRSMKVCAETAEVRAKITARKAAEALPGTD